MAIVPPPQDHPEGCRPGVIFGNQPRSAACPLRPHKRTNVARPATSAVCHKRTKENRFVPIADIRGVRKNKQLVLFRQSQLVAMKSPFVNAQNFLRDLPRAFALHHSRRCGNLCLGIRGNFFCHHAIDLPLTTSSTFGGDLHAAKDNHALCLPCAQSCLQA
jgi:hypothetical protein